MSDSAGRAVIDGARAALRNGDYESPRQPLEKLLAEDPLNAEAHFLLAYTLPVEDLERSSALVERARALGHEPEFELRLVEASIAWWRDDFEAVTDRLDGPAPDDLDTAFATDWSFYRSSALGMQGEAGQADRIEELASAAGQDKALQTSFMLVEAARVLATASASEEDLARRLDLLRRARAVMGHEDPAWRYWYLMFGALEQAGDSTALLAHTGEMLDRAIGGEDFYVWATRGAIALQVGQHDVALEASRRALDLADTADEPVAPELVTAMHSVERVSLLALGHADAALETVTDLPLSSPERVDLEATVLATQGRPAEALEVTARIDDLGATGDYEKSIRVLRGAALAEVGRTDEAAEELQRVLELEPDPRIDGPARLRLTRLALAADDVAAAKGWLAGLDLPPEQVAALAVIRAAVAVADGDVEAARTEVDALEEGGVAPPGQVWGAVTQELRAAERPRDALTAIDEAQRLDASLSSNSGWARARATVLLELRRHGDAIATLEALPPEARDEPEVLFLRASLLMASGRLDEAWPMLEILDADPPDDAGSVRWFAAGSAGLTRQNHADGLRRLDRAMELEPTLERNADFMSIWALAAASLGRADAALAAIDRVETAAFVEQVVRGLAAERAGDLEQATARFDAAAAEAEAALGPVPGAMYRVFAISLRVRRGLFEEVEHQSRETLEQLGEDPAKPTTIGAFLVFLRAWSAHQLGDDEAALEMANGLLDAPTSDVAGAPIRQTEIRALTLTLRGTILLERKEVALAHVAFEHAVELDSSSFSAQLSLSRTARLLGDLVQAIDAAAAAIALASDDDASLGALLAHARAHHEAGHYTAAGRSARNAVRLDEADADTWTEMGKNLLARQRYGAAKEAFLRAWRLGDGDPAAAIGHSGALIHAGENEAAIAWIRDQALPRLERRTDAATIGRCEVLRYNLGVAQFRNGDVGAAKRTFDGLQLPAAGAARQQLTQESESRVWLDYWLSGPGARRAVGVVLAVLFLAALGFSGIAAADVSWVRSTASWQIVLAPLITVGVLLAMPSISRLKVGTLEVDVTPEGPGDEPELDLEPALLSDVLTAEITRLSASFKAPTVSKSVVTERQRTMVDDALR